MSCRVLPPSPSVWDLFSLFFLPSAAFVPNFSHFPPSLTLLSSIPSRNSSCSCPILLSYLLLFFLFFFPSTEQQLRSLDLPTHKSIDLLHAPLPTTRRQSRHRHSLAKTGLSRAARGPSLSTRHSGGYRQFCLYCTALYKSGSRGQSTKPRGRDRQTSIYFLEEDAVELIHTWM